MLTLLFASSAWSAAYTASDVLSAWRGGLSAPLVEGIAGLVTAATETEKACLIAAGVPRALVDQLPGPEATALPPDQVTAVCEPLGLDAAVSPAERERGAAVATESSARHERREQAAAAEARVACYRRMAFEAEPSEIEAWMRGRVRAGATGFVSVDGAEGITRFVCSW